MWVIKNYEIISGYDWLIRYIKYVFILILVIKKMIIKNYYPWDKILQTKI